MDECREVDKYVTRRAVVYPAAGSPGKCGLRIHEYDTRRREWLGSDRWYGGLFCGARWTEAEARKAAREWLDNGMVPKGE